MEVLPSTFEENLDKSQFAHAWEYTIKTSEGKAIDVAHKQKALARAIANLMHVIRILASNLPN